MKLFYLNKERETQCGLVGEDRLSWGRRGLTATQGSREDEDLGTWPLMVSGGTQPAHLIPPPFSHSPRADPWNQGRTRIFFSLPIGWPGQQKIGSPIRKGGGGVSSAGPFGRSPHPCPFSRSSTAQLLHLGVWSLPSVRCSLEEAGSAFTG